MEFVEELRDEVNSGSLSREGRGDQSQDFATVYRNFHCIEPKGGRRMRKHCSISTMRLLAATFFLTGASALAADPVLHLTDGGYVPGALADSEKPGTLSWQGASFVDPFEFDLKAVNAVHSPASADPPRPVADFRFELAGGDVLFGALVDLNDTEAVIDAPPFGLLHVRRTDLRQVDRCRDNAGLIYLGPTGLANWREPSGGAEAKGWRDEAGALATDQDGAAIRADLGIPAKAVIEFEVSWKAKPDFVLALGVGADESTARRAFRFEVWDGELVVVRELDREADMASLGKITSEVMSGPGVVHFRAYLDQERGTLALYSAKGDWLASLKAAVGAPGGVFPGVLLENHRGDVRLDRLRVDRWDGQSPRNSSAGEGGGVRLTDGSTTPGRVTRFDPASKAFFVRDKDGEEIRLAGDRVSQVSVSPRLDDPPRSVRVALQDGSRLSGTLEKVEKGALHLTVPGVRETLRLPSAGLRSLIALKPSIIPTEMEKPPLSGRLELDGVRLNGRLIDGRERAGASCLVWQPLGSASGSPLRPGVSGRIVYKEPPPPRPPGRVALNRADPANARIIARRAQVAQPAQFQFREKGQPAQPVGGIQGFVRGFSGTGTTAASTGPKSLYLRSGDVIPSTVTKIDETGVTFQSPLSENTFVPHDKVKAVELSPEPPGAFRLTKAQRERLLTLPRVQKGSPPTHLIRSLNGDYLRGRVVGLDEKTLRVEVRLELKDVPRDRVSRIIWFHADETEPTKEKERKKEEKEKEGRDEPMRVQAVRGDGVRLTFAAGRVEGGVLSGTSEVLGTCRVKLDEADRILIGGAIESETARLAFQRWKLQNAPEPKDSPGDAGSGSGGRSSGTESALVGKPAPDFALGLLGGKTFRLSESKGQVVVLDFWATWCGPCLQAMPQVETVAREFRDQGVRLVAVNLQEAPEVISAMLERHKLDLTVALDRDGVVAAKYQANAIPQTVIIDRDGTVSRLFVGGGPHLGDQLRDALKALPPAVKK